MPLQSAVFLAEMILQTLSAKPRFVDLFCGIGGFRLAFEDAGAKCVFSCDADKFCRVTYKANFDDEPHGNIYEIAVSEIPEHEILCAGFPCQPFSLAGVSKKKSLGRGHGFKDEKQGNLFLTIAQILSFRRPEAFVLENVKHLKNHDDGRTFRIILDILTKVLGYTVHEAIIDAQGVVPQRRERIFLVGFRDATFFQFPTFSKEGPRLRKILDRNIPDKYTL